MRIISNTELLDKDKSKIAEMQKQKQKDLKSIDYAINLNTGKVKTNNNNTFIIDKDTNIKPNKQDNVIYNQLKDDYIKQMQNFIKYIKKYDNKIYTTDKDLNKDILSFNKYFDKNYINGFNLRVRDLKDEDIKADYLKNYASALTMVQIQEINKIGIDTFINLDLDTSKKLNKIIDIKDLKETQKQLKDAITSKSDADIKTFIEDFNRDDTEFLISDIMLNIIYKHQESNLNKVIAEQDTYYNQVHLLYRQINNSIIDLIDRFKTASETIKNELIIQDITNISVEVKNDDTTGLTMTKLPPNIIIDFDIMQLFNNIYPNYQFKSISDDRHKQIDIKAKLMLDIDINNADDMENLRLINFIKSGKIQLFTIQSDLINGFVKIRDYNQTPDKTIPLLSTLKYITANKKMRLPTSKKDLALYEDFMLFFNKCKIQVKIIDRNTQQTIFEVLKPIPLLANTPAHKDNNYGYIIGNSIINILKNELDSINNTPRQTTLNTNKNYLEDKQPSTPPVINLKKYIYKNIAQMINSYKIRKKYQSKINIECLYDFQAFYNKHPRPTKDDKDKVRDMLNKYLDALIVKGMITGYKQFKAKNDKDITHYIITINKEFKI